MLLSCLETASRWRKGASCFNFPFMPKLTANGNWAGFSSPCWRRRRGDGRGDAQRLPGSLGKGLVSAAATPGVEARTPRCASLSRVRLPVDAAGESPITLLWPLLSTWTHAARSLPPEQRKPGNPPSRGWVCSAPVLKKITRFDHFLDILEGMLEKEPL